MKPSNTRLALSFAATLLLTASPALAGSGIKLAPGQSMTHVLPANPSTGYSWRANPATSENLNFVNIEDLGHAAPKSTPAGPIVGAPQAQSFKITGKSAGTAKIAFEYVRPWEGKPVRQETLTIAVSPP